MYNENNTERREVISSIWVFISLLKRDAEYFSVSNKKKGKMLKRCKEILKMDKDE